MREKKKEKKGDRRGGRGSGRYRQPTLPEQAIRIEKGTPRFDGNEEKQHRGNLVKQDDDVLSWCLILGQRLEAVVRFGVRRCDPRPAVGIRIRFSADLLGVQFSGGADVRYLGIREIRASIATAATQLDHDWPERPMGLGTRAPTAGKHFSFVVRKP